MSSTYPNRIKDLVVAGLPVLNTYSKSAWWVDSEGSNQGDGTFKRPWDSIEIATNSGKVVAGDQIHCKAGHVETVAAIAGLDLDVAGVTIYFHGNGANRAQITFTTAAGADMDIDAAGITLVNPLFVAGIDALTGPIDVNAADFTIINGEWRDAPAMGTIDCIVADAAADRMTIDGWRFVPSTTGTQKQSQIQVAAANDVVLRNIDIFGDFATGPIENGTAWVNALVENVRINNTSASPTVGIFLSATSTGSMRNVHIRVASGTTYLTANNDMEFFECYGSGTDATAGEKIGTQLAGDVEAKIDVIDGYFDVPTVDGTADTTMRDVIGRKTDAAAAGAVSATESVMAYAKQLVTELAVVDEFHDVPAADATANAQINEVVGNKEDAAQVTVGTTRSLVGYVKGLMNSTIRTIEKTDGTVVGTADALFTITGGPIRVKSIIGIVTTVIGAVASNGTLQATVTEPAGTVALSTTVSIVDDAAGTMYHFVGSTGVLTPVTVGAAILDLGSATAAQAEWIVPIGNINFLTSASNTGVIKWYMTYEPLSPSAVVTAAA